MDSEFVREPLADGGERFLLTRLTDGRVMCCVCFEYFTRDRLEPVVDEPGKTWDVCRPCFPSTVREGDPPQQER
jgi:hypothetical protein